MSQPALSKKLTRINVQSKVHSRNNLVGLHLVNPLVEGLHCVAEAEESVLLALVHAIQKLPVGAMLIYHDVDKPPIGNVAEACLHEPVLPDNLRPHRLLPGHGLRHLELLLLAVVPGPLQPETSGEYRPQRLPVVKVSVVAVERLVLGHGVDGRPDVLLGDEVRVGGVAEALPGAKTPRPAQSDPLLAADGGVHAQAAHDVEEAPRREAEDEVGAVHGPAHGAAAPGDCGEEDVLLVVVEVWAVQARHVLGVGRVRSGDLANELERSQVVLGARLERDVGEGGAVGDDDGEDVAEHGGVGLLVLRLSGARGPGDVEDVRDVGERREGLGDGGEVGEIDVYVCQRGG